MKAEMIVPQTVRDQLDQEAQAGITSLRYTFEIRFWNGKDGTPPRLEPAEERLNRITLTESNGTRSESSRGVLVEWINRY
jgi:hypothetical protein